MTRRLLAGFASMLLAISLGACAANEKSGSEPSDPRDTPGAGSSGSTPVDDDSGAVPGGRNSADQGSDTGDGQGDGSP